jgi:hypothetical protein
MLQQTLLQQNWTSGEDRRQRYEIERVSCKNARDHDVTQHKLRELQCGRPVG